MFPRQIALSADPLPTVTSRGIQHGGQLRPLLALTHLGAFSLSEHPRLGTNSYAIPDQRTYI